ncbi:MAG: hypothetical protein AAFY98_11675 [Verrucomicrobiota bacterium]
MRNFLKHLLNRYQYCIHRIDPLTQAMNKAGSDKGWGLKGKHYYTRVYDQIFRKWQHEPITLVEIGLLRPDWDQRRKTQGHEGVSDAVAFAAPSLEAWRAYFPNAKIVGFDIDDFSKVMLKNVHILQGDMSSVDDLKQLLEACNYSMDIVIDDGSHVSHHQQICFSTLFPHLKPGGMYIIEDLHWQDGIYEQSEAMKTREMLRRFRVTGTLESNDFSAKQGAEIAASIDHVRFYDSIETTVEDTEDALCVIVKKG